MSPSSVAARPEAQMGSMHIAVGAIGRVPGQSFAVTFDDKARRWLNEHPSQDALVIAYEDSRCCGGGHIRDVRLRRSTRRDESSSLVDIGDVTGRRILLDRRIMLRMPHKIPVTVGG